MLLAIVLLWYVYSHQYDMNYALSVLFWRLNNEWKKTLTLGGAHIYLLQRECTIALIYHFTSIMSIYNIGR